MMTISINNGYFNYNCPCCTLWFDESNFRNHLPYQATDLIIDGLKTLCTTLEMQVPPKGALVVPAPIRDNEDIEARAIAKQKILDWWQEARV